MYIYTHMYVYVCVCIYKYIHAYTYAHIHIHKHTLHLARLTIALRLNSDPHELAKLHALYQTREHVLEQHLRSIEHDLQIVVASFDETSSRSFADMSTGQIVGPF